MSIYHYDQPAAINDFRENTAKQAKMAGVTTASFVCKQCGQRKRTAGRKQVSNYKKDGYRCAECVSK